MAIRALLVLSRKKQRHIDAPALVDLARTHGIECDVTEADKLEEMQGRQYHVILHKTTDFAARSRSGDTDAQRVVDNLKAFIASQPSSCVVLDPLDRSEVLLDREKTCEKLLQCIHDHGHWHITSPPSVVVRDEAELKQLATRLEHAHVSLPAVCKAITAHGSRAAHEMCLLLSAEAAPSIAPPFIVQQFIPHNGVLVKVFALADTFFVCHRPSIRNTVHEDAGDACIAFDSHDISKPDSQSHLNEEGAHMSEQPVNDDEVIGSMVRAVRKEFGLSLFGIDAVVEQGAHNLHVVDVNYFPGYAGMQNFHLNLCRLIKDSAQAARAPE